MLMGFLEHHRERKGQFSKEKGARTSEGNMRRKKKKGRKNWFFGRLGEEKVKE